MDFQKTLPFAKPPFLPPVPFSPVLSHPFPGLIPCQALFLPLLWLRVNTDIMGFPGGISGDESACQHRKYKRCVFSPWVGKIPWRRKWQHTPVFLPGKSHRQRSLAGYRPWGHKRVGHDWATQPQYRDSSKLCSWGRLRESKVNRASLRLKQDKKNSKKRFSSYVWNTNSVCEETWAEQTKRNEF